MDQLREDSLKVTCMIEAAAAGDSRAAAQLLDLLRDFASKRFLGRERKCLSLQATLLADEAFLQLIDRPNPGQVKTRFMNGTHFFCAAADVIRNLLIDRARVALSQIDEPDTNDDNSDVDHEELSAAITRLEELSPRAATVVKMRFYTGLTVTETASTMEISERTVAYEWNFARAWLARELGEG
jgi:RNA polymerase sigma factor (TIGR02999 family)